MASCCSMNACFPGIACIPALPASLPACLLASLSVAACYHFSLSLPASALVTGNVMWAALATLFAIVTRIFYTFATSSITCYILLLPSCLTYHFTPHPGSVRHCLHVCIPYCTTLTPPLILPTVDLTSLCPYNFQHRAFPSTMPLPTTFFYSTRVTFLILWFICCRKLSDKEPVLLTL